MFSTPGTVRAFCSTSDTSLSTRSGLAPGYTVTTIRYGVLTSGSRLVCIFVMATKPGISTITTATSTVNGFLTLNFSIFPTVSLPCAAAPQSSPQRVVHTLTFLLYTEDVKVATDPTAFFRKTFNLCRLFGTKFRHTPPEIRSGGPDHYTRRILFLRGNVLLNMVY